MASEFFITRVTQVALLICLALFAVGWLVPYDPATVAALWLLISLPIFRISVLTGNLFLMGERWMALMGLVVILLMAVGFIIGHQV
jgi:hypothetical protein